MGFPEEIQGLLDSRVETLGRIKVRSLGADSLTLTALNVLVYAQLEGGVKDLSARLVRRLNAYNLTFANINPKLLEWRNGKELERFRKTISFSNISSANPFAPLLAEKAKVRPINRRFEFNQMHWEELTSIYSGLGLTVAQIARSRQDISALVEMRNDAAHHGVPSKMAAKLLGELVRQHALAVGTVLTDFSLQLLVFFENKLHRR